MRIIGCDLHARQQTIAMLDTDTGELVERTLEQEGEKVRKFYAALPGPVRVGIEAAGSMQWFLQLMEELKIEYPVGHPAKIRKAETGLTGLLVLLLRTTSALATILILHLAAVAALFLTAPYGQFVHLVYRSFALLRFEIERGAELIR